MSLIECLPYAKGPSCTPEMRELAMDRYEVLAGAPYEEAGSGDGDDEFHSAEDS